MYKGFFKIRSMRIIASIKSKSYSRKCDSSARFLAVSFAIITLASCGNKTENGMFHTAESAANTYRSYLSEVRKENNLSTDRLIEEINEWQTLRDSVFTYIANDTTKHPHNNYEHVIQALHDSLRIEFTRLALEKPRTLTDVLLIKEQTSQYRQDQELMQAVAEAEPFFKFLDSAPIYRVSAKAIIAKYHSFLAETLDNGIGSKDDMLAFIKEEDRLFRSFLDHLPELADADLSAITRDTEKCCLSIFRSAENGKLSYRDALIYTAKRTNRRVILNALTCRDDINHNKVKTEAQARAYVWMLLQPYIALDGFSAVVLSDMERSKLYEVAEQTPSMIAKLNKAIGLDNDQWQVLPELLVKIMITSI